MIFIQKQLVSNIQPYFHKGIGNKCTEGNSETIFVKDFFRGLHTINAGN